MGYRRREGIPCGYLTIGMSCRLHDEQSYGMVVHNADVEARIPAELYIGACERQVSHSTVNRKAALTC